MGAPGAQRAASRRTASCSSMTSTSAQETLYGLSVTSCSLDSQLLVTLYLAILLRLTFTAAKSCNSNLGRWVYPETDGAWKLSRDHLKTASIHLTCQVLSSGGRGLSRKLTPYQPALEHMPATQMRILQHTATSCAVRTPRCI